MKLFKKVGAVVLVLAMIAVLMPQLGSVVKAAATGTYVYNVSKKDSYFTLNENGTGALSTNPGAKATNFTNGGYKTGYQTFDFTVPADKYAVVEFNMLLRYSNKPCYYVVKKGTEILAQELTTQYPDLRIGHTQLYDSATVVDSEHFILPVVCEAGTYTIARDESTKNEAVLYQIKVTEYDTQEDATTIVDTYVKTITEKQKYTLSGTITSEVDLTDGTVSLSSKTAGASAATGDGTNNGSISFNYENATYVELSVGTDNDNLYLKKIEVTPDTTNPAVSTLGASVRQETAEWGNGIRFGGMLNLNKTGENSTSGTLIGLKSVVNDATMTLKDVQKTCINVVRTTYITQDESSLEYAAALINIPDDNLDTEIVARPYVTIGDNTYYGEQITITYNTAQEIVNGQ